MPEIRHFPRSRPFHQLFRFRLAGVTGAVLVQHRAKQSGVIRRALLGFRAKCAQWLNMMGVENASLAEDIPLKDFHILRDGFADLAPAPGGCPVSAGNVSFRLFLRPRRAVGNLPGRTVLR